MALEWFHREDGHGGSWLYIVQERQQGHVLEQDTDTIDASLPKMKEKTAEGSRRAMFKREEMQIQNMWTTG